MDVDARKAEAALAIATEVATSLKPHSPPEGLPASKMRRRLQLDGAAEILSLGDPGTSVTTTLPNAGGAAAADNPTKTAHGITC